MLCPEDAMILRGRFLNSFWIWSEAAMPLLLISYTVRIRPM